MGKTVNQIELAATFGVAEKTIREWHAEGLPALTFGPNANEYDTEACIGWYAAREVAKATKETPRDRESRLRSELMELELAEKRDVLVPVDQVEPVWRERVFAAAAFMMGQPSRLAGMLEGAPGIEAKRDVLRREFAEFLNKLGVDGEQMQQEIQEFTERLSAQDAAQLLARFTKGHGVQPDASQSAQPGVAGVRPDAQDPPVGVG